MHAFIRILLLLLILQMIPPESMHAQPSNREIAALDSSVDRIRHASIINKDSAAQVLEGIYEHCRRIGYDYGMANAMLTAGILYVNGEGTPAPGYTYFVRAKPYLREACKKNKDLYARWCTCMGAVSLKTGKPDSAMYYYALSLNDLQKRGSRNYNAILQNYVNIAVICFEMEEFTKGLQYINKAIALAGQQGLKPEQLNNYLTAAAVYTQLKEFDSAAYFTAKARQLNTPVSSFQEKTMNELDGLIALNRKRPEAAIQYFRKAMAANTYPSPNGTRGLGEAYRMLGNNVLAEKYLTEAKDALQQMSSPSMLIEVYNNLADLYDSTQRYRMAYEHRSLAAALQKEFSDKDRVKAVNQLEIKYRSAEKDKALSQKQLALLSANSSLRIKNFWMAIIALIAAALIALVLFLIQKHKLQEQRSASFLQQQEIEKLKAVIDAEEKERSRIGRELHDNIMVQLSIVKMNLQALPVEFPAITTSRDFISINEQLNNAGRDIRQTAHNLIPDTLMAEGLVQAVLYFCNNVQHRTGLMVNFQHYGYISPLGQETELSLYRIIQELLQNVIKHAGATTVLIQLNYRDDMVTLAVEDDGKGLDQSTLTATDGMGLKGIRSRLKAINGTLDIHSRQPKGTSISIEIIA